MKKFIAVLLLLLTVVISAPAVVDACTYYTDDVEKKCLYAEGASFAAGPSSVSNNALGPHTYQNWTRFTHEWVNFVYAIFCAFGINRDNCASTLPY